MTDHTDETRTFLTSQQVQVLCGAIVLLLFAQSFRLQDLSRQLLPPGIIKRPSWKLPPGPSGWPILGSLPHFQRASRTSISLSDWVWGAFRKFEQMTR